ncbi:MAG: hypothetical protein AAFX94_22605, partial [Myxococcota bacterium]
MAPSHASGVVRLDDPTLKRWLDALSDDELSVGLRSIVARAQHLVMVLDLLSFNELEEQGLEIESVFSELRERVAPVREAADGLSQAFVTVGHIDVHTLESEAGTVGARRLRASSSLNGIRRLIAREWRILGERLKDQTVRSSPNILIAFCRAHLDRIQTLVECIGPTLYAVLAPPGDHAEQMELQGALTIRGNVVDFYRAVHDVGRTLQGVAPKDWQPYLQQTAEA